MWIMFAKKYRGEMAKTKKTGSVKIYGDVSVYGYNSAAAFIERFEEARRGADEMNVRLHTDGGNVMEGTLIYNHIKGCDIPVDVYIDGVCCSMGTVIMMAARKVYMCENSYLMVHAPRGGCFGTALDMEKTAKCLRGMEKNFKKIYATKTGRDEEGMKDLLNGDNWFTAQEAMDAKLIDGIVEPIATDVTPISAEELKSQSPQALYNRFSACLAGMAEGEKDGQGVFSSSNNQNKKGEMDKKDLIEKFGLTGVTAQSTDAEVYAAMQAKMDADKTRADNAEQALASAGKKKITDAVKAALDAKKIDEKQKETYVAIGEKSGFEALMVVLDGLKPAPSLVGFARGGTGALGQAGGQGVSRAEWTWEQWQKEDPRGLEKLAKDEPEKFEALYQGMFK